MSLPTNNRHGLSRVPLHLPVTFGQSRREMGKSGTTRNIGPHGVYVATDKPPDTCPRLLLQVEFKKSPIELIGRVMWVRPPNPTRPESGGFGMQILLAPDTWYQHFLPMC